MKLTKQTALKAALLAVLATNVSWEKMDFHSVQLASEVKTAGAGTAPAGTGDGKVSTAPEALTVKATGDSPAAVKLTLPSHEAESRICGDLYKVHYQQVAREGGKMMTEITAIRASRANDAAVSITWKEDLINTMVKKSEADNVLAAAVKAHRTIKKEACAGEPARSGSTEVADDKDKAERDEEKKRIADGMKNCTLNRKGETLKGSEAKLECWIDQLSNIGQRVGKHKSEDAEGKAVLAELQRIVRGPFKRLLKDALLSDDDDRVEHAKDMAKDAIDTIQEVGAEYDLGRTRNGRSNSAISKLVGEIEGLKKGAETKQESDKYSDRAKDVRYNLRTARTEYSSLMAIRDQAYQAAMRNPLDPYAQQAYWEANQALTNSQQTMNFLVGDYEALRLDIGMNLEPNYIRPLRSMQTSGLMTSTDYNEFTQPFLELQKMLRETRSFTSLNPQSALTQTTRPTGSITSSLLGADRAIPTDLAVVRSVGTVGTGGAAIGSRINGLPSAAPTLSFPAPRSIFSNP